MDEREKYERMHKVPDYSPGPGAAHAGAFMACYLKGGETVIDFGCGTGDAALLMYEKGHDVYLVDIASNCLRDSVRREIGSRFFVSALHELPEDLPARDWGFCSDVMEHLPPEWVAPSLAAMRSKVRNCFFAISGHPDAWGRHIGEVLHLSVHPRPWWVREIGRHWQTVEEINESNSTYLLVGRS